MWQRSIKHWIKFSKRIELKLNNGVLETVHRRDVIITNNFADNVEQFEIILTEIQFSCLSQFIFSLPRNWPLAWEFSSLQKKSLITRIFKILSAEYFLSRWWIVIDRHYCHKLLSAAKKSSKNVKRMQKWEYFVRHLFSHKTVVDISKLISRFSFHTFASKSRVYQSFKNKKKKFSPIIMGHFSCTFLSAFLHCSDTSVCIYRAKMLIIIRMQCRLVVLVKFLFSSQMTFSQEVCTTTFAVSGANIFDLIKNR